VLPRYYSQKRLSEYISWQNYRGCFCRHQKDREDLKEDQRDHSRRGDTGRAEGVCIRGSEDDA